MQSAVAGAGTPCRCSPGRVIAATANPEPRRAPSTKRAFSTHPHPTTTSRPRNPHRPFGQGVLRGSVRMLHRGETGVRTARVRTARSIPMQRQGDLPRRCAGSQGWEARGNPFLGGTPVETGVTRAATCQRRQARASDFPDRITKMGILCRGRREVWRHATIDRHERGPICFMRFKPKVRPLPGDLDAEPPDRSAHLAPEPLRRLASSTFAHGKATALPADARIFSGMPGQRLERDPS